MSSNIEAEKEVLNVGSQKELDKILIKTIPELSSKEVAFIRARQTYLSDKQVKFYKSILKDDKDSGKDDTELIYQDLQDEALSLGMPNVVGKSKKNLIEFIKNNIN